MPTFATGATLLYPKDGASNFEQLAGQKVGVLAGSTTETGLKKALEAAKIDAIIVAVPTHRDGIERLASGELAAYFGDGAILLYQLMQSPFRERLLLADKVLSFEPYALALPKGDDAFRLVVDRALARTLAHRPDQCGVRAQFRCRCQAQQVDRGVVDPGRSSGVGRLSHRPWAW